MYDKPHSDYYSMKYSKKPKFHANSKATFIIDKTREFGQKVNMIMKIKK